MGRSRFTMLLTVFVVCGFGVSTSVVAQSAAQVSETVSNSGVVTDLDLKSRPGVVWRFSADDVSLRALRTAEEAVFVATEDGAIHALRSTDGLKLWESHFIARQQITGMHISVNETAAYLVATTEAGITTLDLKTGAAVWKMEVDQGLAEPLVVDRRVFAGGFDGTLYSFSLETGEIFWKHDFLHDAPPDPPGFDGERARFGDKPARPRALSSNGESVFLTVFDQCRVLAVDADTGRRAWDLQTQGWMFGRPAVGKDRIFVGSQDKNLYAVDIGSGNLSWISKTKSRVEASAAVTDRYVLFGSCDANLYCHDRVTGHLVWKYATDKYEKYGGPIYAQPIVSEKSVYLATMEGQIYKFQIDDGKLLWKIRPSDDSQIVDSCTDGKRIYVTTRENFDGKGINALFAIGPK